MKIIINSTKAREQFADLLNRVYYGGDQVVIKKQGKAIVQITKIQNTKTKKQKNNTNTFLTKLSKYNLKAPKNFAKKHDSYIWD